MINRNDFQYMWRGKATRPLDETEEKLLSPINYHKRKKDSGRALLLLHGFSSSPAVYRALKPRLKHYDALICPALPGHAENLAAFASVTHEEWLSAASTACESLIQRYDHVEIIGLSLGGLLACHLAEKFPIQRLYLLAPALKLRVNMGLAKIAAHTLHSLGFKYLKNRAGNLHTHEHEELAYRKLPLHTIIELFSFIQKSTPSLSIPNCKTDLFLGVHDDVIDSEYAAKKFEGNSQCCIHWLDRSAHAIPLDGDLDILSAYINDYKSCMAEPS